MRIAPGSVTDNEKKARMGRAAHEILFSDEGQEAIAAIRKDVIADWEDSDTPDLREECWYVLEGLGLLIEYLKRMIHAGEVAEYVLEQTE